MSPLRAPAPMGGNFSLCAGSCGTIFPRAGALSDMHDRVLESSVDGSRTHCVVCETLRVLWKRHTSRETYVPHAPCDARVSCTLRHVSTCSHWSGTGVLRSPQGRNQKTRRQSKAYKREERETWYNLHPRTNFTEPTRTKNFFGSHTSTTSLSCKITTILQTVSCRAGGALENLSRKRDTNSIVIWCRTSKSRRFEARNSLTLLDISTHIVASTRTCSTNTTVRSLLPELPPSIFWVCRRLQREDTTHQACYEHTNHLRDVASLFLQRRKRSATHSAEAPINQHRDVGNRCPNVLVERRPTLWMSDSGCFTRRTVEYQSMQWRPDFKGLKKKLEDGSALGTR